MLIKFLLADILNFHSQLENKSTGVRDLRLIESAVNAPFQTFGGQDLYPTIFDKAAQLAFGLTKNHGFVDGNKRVAIHAMEVYLFINGYDTNFSQEEIIKIGFELAEGKLSAENLSELLKSRTFEIEP